MTAGLGIGGSAGSQPIRTNLTNSETGVLSAITASGPISIEEISGTLTVGAINSAARGDVSVVGQSHVLPADPATSYVQGGAISITSRVGSVGSLGTAGTAKTLGSGNAKLVVDTGTMARDTLTVNAADDVYVEERTGDLRLFQATTNGDVRMRVASGNLIDANSNETRDTRTEAQLFQLYDRMQATTTTAQQSIDATIEAFEGVRTREYHAYWRTRQNQSNDRVSGLMHGKTYYAVYDPAEPTKIKLATSHANATANPPVTIDLTASQVSGASHRFRLPSHLTVGFNSISSVDSAAETITLGSGHGVANGTAIVYERLVAYDSNHQVTLTASESAAFTDYYTQAGTAQGLTGNDLTQYVSTAIATLLSLRTADYHALHKVYGIVGNVTSNAAHYSADVYDPAWSYSVTDPELHRTFQGSSIAGNAITIGPHVFRTGQALMYQAAGGSITGLTDKATYYAIVDPAHPDQIQLASSYANATSPSPIVMTISGVGATGTGHWFSDGDVLKQRAAWSESQLKNSISAGILRPKSVSGTTATTEDPNILANQVFIDIEGQIGVASGQYDITLPLPANLSDEQKLALAGAERGDAKFYADVAGTIEVLPDDANVTIALIRITTIEDVDLDAGSLVNADANTDIFLGSEKSLQLDNVSGGGMIRIKVQQGLTNPHLPADLTANVTGGDMVLEGETQSIGVSTNPLRVNLQPNATLTARAGDDIYIEETSGNLLLREAFASQHISMTVRNGSLLDPDDDDSQLPSGNWNLNAETALLIVPTGQTIGTSSRFLEMDLQSDGQITAHADGSIFLHEVLGDMHVDRVVSDHGDVHLKADVSILDNDESGSPTPEVDVIGNEIQLTAHSGAIGASGFELFIDTAHSAAGGLASSSEVNSYIIEPLGNLALRTIHSATGTAYIGALGGAITNGNNGNANVLAGKTWLFAAGDIGTPAAPVGTVSGNLEAASTTGSVYVMNTGPLEIGGVAASVGQTAASGITAHDTILVGAMSPVTVTENLTSAEQIVILSVEDSNDAPGNEDDITLAPTARVRTVGPGGKPLAPLVASNVYYVSVSGDNITLLDGPVGVGQPINLGTPSGGGIANKHLLTPIAGLHAGTNSLNAVDSKAFDLNDVSGTTIHLPNHGLVTGEQVMYTTAGTILVLSGDDVRLQSGSQIESVSDVFLYGDFHGSDGQGAHFDVRGSIAAEAVTFYGSNHDDTAHIEPDALSGHLRFLMGNGDDSIRVTDLPTITTTRDRATDQLATSIRDTLDLDGQGGSDAIEIDFNGTSDYRINVHDSGNANDGNDTLRLNGLAQDDTFLLRKKFVAFLHGNVTDGFDPDVERVNYDSSINARLELYGMAGNDRFISDDNSSITTIDGGEGADHFQIGQVFGTQRDASAGVATGDEIQTSFTTRGYLSRGVSYPMTIFGGLGTDSFSVYQNTAPLRLEGGDGNDEFIVRAFALADENDPQQAKTQVNGGGGEDFIQYAVNAPVGIDGGDGSDTVVAVGSEFDDNIVVTNTGIFGAGLKITYENVEKVEVDSVEGNDHFFVLSTNKDVVVSLIGGPGSDTFDVMGDVTDVISVSSGEGRSGVISHSVTSNDPVYDELGVEMIVLNVADNDTGEAGVVFSVPDGHTLVSESGTVDSYQIMLPGVAPNPLDPVYVTISAPLPELVEQLLGGAGVLVSLDGIHYDRSVVITFSVPTDWNVARTVYVKAEDDQLAEGERTVVLSHSIHSASTSYQEAPTRDIHVQVVDNDSAGVVIVESNTDTRVLEGGITDTYTLALTSPPAPGKTVTVNVQVDSQVTVSPALLTFNASNWNTPQTVTVTAVSDGVRESRIMSTILHDVTSDDPAYNLNDTGKLEVEVLDEDSAGVLVTQTNGATFVVEGGTPDTYDLVLTSQPSASVTVQIHTDGQTLVSSTDPRFNVASQSVTFTPGNWSSPITVSVLADDSFNSQSQVPTTFDLPSHQLTDIAGPLLIDGGIGTGEDRSLVVPILFPVDETDTPIGSPDTGSESEHIDRVRVYNDQSTADDTGVLTSTNLSGLGMGGSLTINEGSQQSPVYATYAGGITYHDLEVLEVLLGKGDDQFTVNSTAPGVVTAIHGGGGDDTLTVIAGGGPTSPLILYGDTTVDQVRYSGDSAVADEHGLPFNNPGNDTINASASSSGVIVYGGPGNDTITGSQAGDHLAGGEGNDQILGQQGSDHLYGDSGFNIQLPVRVYDAQFHATTLPLTFSIAVTETAGDDQLFGEAGNDILFGDHGRVTLDGKLPTQTTGYVLQATTYSPANSGSDDLQSGPGDDLVFGGGSSDWINVDRNTQLPLSDAGRDLVVGDSGTALFDVTSQATGAYLLREVHSTDADYGANDAIHTGVDNDVVLGGSGLDQLDLGSDTSRDIALGDNGLARFDATGVLIEIRSSDPSIGGDDSILVGDGPDVVLGGVGADRVNYDALLTPVGTDSAADVIVGDNGFALFDNLAGASLLRQIETSDADHGGGDAIFASDGFDVVLGGSGADQIDAGTDGSRDIVVGDNGAALFDLAGVLVDIRTTVPAVGGDDAILVGDGNDVVLGGIGADRINVDVSLQPVGTDTGEDVIVGDNGFALFDNHQGASLLRQIETSDETHGGADTIFASNGFDVVLGGTGADSINAGTDASRDIAVGDNGTALFDSNGVLIEIRTTVPLIGGDDVILVGGGSDVALGGSGADSIDAGTDAARDIVVGDNGVALFDTGGVLLEIRTTVPDVGGDDSLLVGDGPDVVLGGIGADRINVDLQLQPVGTDSGADVIVGDNGFALFDSVNGASLLRQIETSDSAHGGGDTIFASNGFDVVLGGSGSDSIDAGTDGSRDIVVGDNGAALFDLAGVLIDIRSTVPAVGGDDAILVGDGPDVVLGGVGADRINVDGLLQPVGTDTGADVIVGDNGIALFDNVAGASLLRRIETASVNDGGNDTIFASDGFDVVLGGTGADSINAGTDASRDIVVGDNGFAVFDAAGVLTEIRTADPSVGGNDSILVGNGPDVVLGGVGADSVNFDGSLQPVGIDTGEDVIVGDNGFALFDNLQGVSLLRRIETTDVLQGGNDAIFAADGFDVVLGGSGADTIDAGTDASRDIVVGDNGVAVFDAAGILLDIRTADPSVGGADVIVVGNGPDVVLGGVGGDRINYDASLQPIGTDSGADVIMGDNGLATFVASAGQSVLTHIETTDPDHGGDDQIFAADGVDVVIGGSGADSIDAGTDASRDVVVGDNGSADFTSGILTYITTAIPTAGGDDTIRSGNGPDVVLGGLGGDSIDAGTDNSGDTARDVIIGDHGNATFTTAGILTLIQTTQPSIGGQDFITTGGGADIVVGGAAGDNIQAGADADVILGDNGVARFATLTGLLNDASTTDPSIGGNDTIDAGAGRDVAFGGAAADTINGRADRDILFGDNGFVDYLANDNDPLTLDVLSSSDPLQGGNDQLMGDEEFDILIGGTGADDLQGGADHDVLMGDHGRIDMSLPVDQNFRSIFIGASEGAGDDLLRGGTGDDFLLGQQGNDQLFGEEGDDDLTGGHNVLFGVDGNDTITGGDGADVVLGDNGTITRQLLPNQDTVWAKHAAPFADVIRSVQRFDDADLIQGNDTIDGQAGDDILHGQRGNDTIQGGANDDELLGELGDDVLSGGTGNDVLLADVGYVVRDYNADGSPRVNLNGSWHRDVILEDVGLLAGSIEMDVTPLRTLDPQLAKKLLETDLAVLTGTFNAQGQKVVQSDSNAWATHALLIDLATANHDQADGGDGEDMIFGQRGNDILTGGSQNDLIVGDRGRNATPYDMELPHIYQNVRLIGTAPGVTTDLQLGTFGTSISPPMTIQPSELSRNDPFDLPNLWGNTITEDLAGARELVGGGTLVRQNGTILRPFAGVVTDVSHHLDNLPGNDQLSGDGGDDMMIADDLNVYVPLLTGLQAVDDATEAARDAFQLAMHTGRSLAVDYERLQRDVYNVPLSYQVRFANDTLAGGNGRDTMIGDDGLVIPSFTLGLPVNAALHATKAQQVYDYLRDVEYIGADFENVLFESHYQTLLEGINASPGVITTQATPDLHKLVFANDQLTGDADDDTMIGDQGTLVSATVNATRFNNIAATSPLGTGTFTNTSNVLATQRTARDAALANHRAAHHNRLSRTLSSAQLSRIPWDFEYLADMGNDTLNGLAGNDLVVGDFGVFLTSVLTTNPTTVEQRSAAFQQIRDQANDVARFLERRRHDFEDTPLLIQYKHPHFTMRGGVAQEVPVVTGNDQVLGGTGHDYLLGDSMSASATYQTLNTATRFDEPDPEFKVQYLARADFGMINHYSRTAVGSSIARDYIDGEADNDMIFGEEGNDAVHGGTGDDTVFGGTGVNTATGGTGVNDVRAGSDDRPEGTRLDRLEDYWFARQQPWMVQLIDDVQQDPLRVGNYEMDGVAGGFVVPEFVQGPRYDDVIARTGGDWWMGESDGTKFVTRKLATWGAGTWKYPMVGDVDGDGVQDVIGWNNGVWRVGRSNFGAPVSENWGQWSTAVVWSDIQAADVNGDGRTDIIGRTSGSWWVSLSTGTSFTIQKWAQWSTAVTWADVRTGDFNGDGRTDIAGRAGGAWWIAVSNGSAFVNQSFGSWSMASPWSDVVVGDFNGDGKSDIAGRAAGVWSVSLSTGTSFVTQAWGSWSTAVTWANVQVLDVDGDGRSDIIGRTGGSWWVARSNGSSFTNQLWLSLAASATWVDVRAADVNGDGADDLLGREPTTGRWQVGVSSGNTYAVQTFAQWSTAVGWFDVLVGDFG